MTASESVRICLKNYATFGGTASRSEFWWFFLAGAFSVWAASAVAGSVAALLLIALLLPMLAAGSRRLQDCGSSGLWLLLLAFFPLGPFLLLLAWARPSSKAAAEADQGGSAQPGLQTAGTRKRPPWFAPVVVLLLVGAGLGGIAFMGWTRQGYIKRSEVAGALARLEDLRSYVKKSGRLPASLEEVGVKPLYEDPSGDPETGTSYKFRYRFTLSADSVTVTFDTVSDKGPVTMILRPDAGGGFDCRGGTLENALRPAACR